jgi:zinc transport system permease protein
MDFSFLEMHSLSAALGVALLLGVLSPLVGIFLVMRRFSLLADTLAHVSLFGVAVSAWFALPISIGAFLGAVFGGIGIELFRQSRRVLSEATLAIFLSGSLALAVLLFTLRGVDSEEVEAYLFGDLTLVTGHDLFWLLAIAVVLIAFFVAFYRQLFLTTLDEDLARVNGVAVKRLSLIFMLFASIVVAAAIKIVGVLLVSSLIVLPVMAALQWRLGFRQTLLLSLSLSELAVVCGFMGAFFSGIPSGASIALTALLAFLLSYFAQWGRH